MLFGLSNDPTVFEESMNQLLPFVKQQPLVKKIVKRGAVLKAHIDDMLLKGAYSALCLHPSCIVMPGTRYR